MNFTKLNETLNKAEDVQKYTLTIITDRDRDDDGELTKDTFNAANDFQALLHVFRNYNLQNAGMFNGKYPEEDLDEEDIELKNKILNCTDVKEGVKLLTDLYFINFDISDYYDDIVSLEGPNGIVIKDDIDVDDWFQSEDDEYDDEEYEDEEY